MAETEVASTFIKCRDSGNCKWVIELKVKYFPIIKPHCVVTSVLLCSYFKQRNFIKSCSVHPHTLFFPLAIKSVIMMTQTIMVQLVKTLHIAGKQCLGKQWAFSFFTNLVISSWLQDLSLPVFYNKLAFNCCFNIHYGFCNSQPLLSVSIYQVSSVFLNIIQFVYNFGEGFKVSFVCVTDDVSLVFFPYCIQS